MASALRRVKNSFFTPPDLEHDARIAALKAELYNVVQDVPVRTWRSTIWDSLDKHVYERRFLLKLDLIMLSLASLGYIIKQIDETNVNNAFVSGMKEDLGMVGDQLSNAKALYTAGYVIGQVPSNLLLTRINPSRWIPSAELAWSILTLAMYAVKNYRAIYGIRFLTGLFESTFYPGLILVMASHYRADELAKRTVIFHTAGAAGRLFSGVLQAATYTNLDGVNGLAGWRWLFITNAIISLPIALAGFVFYPPMPHNMRRSWIWSERDIAISQLRMERTGRAKSQPWTKAKVKRILTGWRFWILPYLYVFWNNSTGMADIFAYWLKGWNLPGKPVVFTVPQINHYPLPGIALGIVVALVMAWLSDGWLKGRRWPLPVLNSTFVIGVAIALLVVPLYDPQYKVTHYVLYSLTPVLTGQSGLHLTWINELCSGDLEERALVVGAANDFAYLHQIWENLSVWRTSYMPAARPGIIFTICVLSAQIIWTGVILLFIRWEKNKKAPSFDSESVDDSSSGEDNVVEVKLGDEAIIPPTLMSEKKHSSVSLAIREEKN